jgi:hypothetical protein
VENGPAADILEALQPQGFSCNHMMKMMIIIIFVLFLVMEHQWNEIDRGRPKYLGKNQAQCHFVHHKSHVD